MSSGYKLKKKSKKSPNRKLLQRGPIPPFEKYLMAVLSSGDLERKQIRKFDNRGRKYYYHSLKSVNRAFQMGQTLKSNRNSITGRFSTCQK